MFHQAVGLLGRGQEVVTGCAHTAQSLVHLVFVRFSHCSKTMDIPKASLVKVSISGVPKLIFCLLTDFILFVLKIGF